MDTEQQQIQNLSNLLQSLQTQFSSISQLNRDTDDRLYSIENYLFTHTSTLENNLEQNTAITFSQYSQIDFDINTSNSITLSNIKPVFDRPTISHESGETEFVYDNNTNEPIEITDLNKYFQSVLNNPLTFIVTEISPNDIRKSLYYDTDYISGINNGILYSSNLTIFPDYRGTNVSIKVSAIDTDRLYSYIEDSSTRFLSESITFHVNELSLPPIEPLKDKIDVTFQNKDIGNTYNLLNIYSGSTQSILEDFFNTYINDPDIKIRLNFEILNSNELHNICDINEYNQILYTPDFRAGTTIVSVQATDSIYNSSALINIHVKEPEPIYLAFPYNYSNLVEQYYNIFDISLNDYFISNRDDGLIVFDITSNTSHSDVVTIIDPSNISISTDFRNDQYSVLINASDPDYSTYIISFEFKITEIKAPEPILIDVNEIVIDQLAHVTIDLNDYFQSRTKNTDLIFDFYNQINSYSDLFILNQNILN